MTDSEPSADDRFEVGLGHLRALRLREEGRLPGILRNEATTRLQIIDNILIDALQWPRDACRAEERYNGDYTDYSLGLPATSLIVEAKREGAYFELPSGGSAATTPIRILLVDNEDLRLAMVQAMQYCSTRGVGLAAVCNGSQLIAFLGSRNDSTPPMEGRALVFYSLSDMEGHFRLMWNALSPSGVVEGRLASLLRAHPTPPAPRKLSSHLPTYQSQQRRNTLQDNLRIIGEVLLEDLTEIPELSDQFLDIAYAPSGALSQSAYVSREILRHRYAAIEQTEVVRPAQDRGHVAPELLQAMASPGVGNRPIVLLGDVGVGKTTFIKHLVRVDARQELTSAIVVNIDFRAAGFHESRGDIRTFVEDTIFAQLRDLYDIDCHSNAVLRSIYHSDIQRFRNSLYGPLYASDPDKYQEYEREMLESHIADRESHLGLSIREIVRGRLRPVVIFLDNIDQFPQVFQEDVFLIAEAMTRNWSATVFVSLRPATFNLSSREGVLSAFTPRVFTVAPPRVDVVLARRFRFAREVLLAGNYAFLPFVSVDSDTLREFMLILERSFWQSLDLREAVDSISKGNIRNALQLLATFIGSGHTNTEKMLSIFRDTGHYTVATHEFIRAVIYGDRFYYDPESSPVCNLFDMSTVDVHEHFLGSIVAYLVQQLPVSRSTEFGYLGEAEIYEYCQALGFTQAQILFALSRLVRKGVVEYEELPRMEQPRLARVRITRLGGYTIQRLISMFAYVDAVVVDTPIMDDTVRGMIGDAVTLRERVNRARNFRVYLDSCWAGWGTEGTGFDWSGYSMRLNADIEHVASYT
jgi:hypothetical protein